MMLDDDKEMLAVVASFDCDVITGEEKLIAEEVEAEGAMVLIDCELITGEEKIIISEVLLEETIAAEDVVMTEVACPSMLRSTEEAVVGSTLFPEVRITAALIDIVDTGAKSDEDTITVTGGCCTEMISTSGT